MFGLAGAVGRHHPSYGAAFLQVSGVSILPGEWDAQLLIFSSMVMCMQNGWTEGEKDQGADYMHPGEESYMVVQGCV